MVVEGLSSGVRQSVFKTQFLGTLIKFPVLQPLLMRKIGINIIKKQ